jgi:hypothetical protein
MSERRGRLWVFILSAIGIAVGMASCAHPAWSQHPVHNPPPPPRPPAHQPAPRPSPPPQRAAVKQQQAPVPQRAVTPQPPPQQPSGAPGTIIPPPPPLGTRVPSGNTVVPHPPDRPWQHDNAVPPSERPPPGMCRVWLDKVPAASQPAPTSCSKAIQMRPPNGHVIFGEDGRRPTATRVPPATPSEPSAPESPLADH